MYGTRDGWQCVRPGTQRKDAARCAAAEPSVAQAGCACASAQRTPELVARVRVGTEGRALTQRQL